MSVRTYVQFKCDRCGSYVRAADVKDVPSGWISKDDLHICTVCSDPVGRAAVGKLKAIAVMLCKPACGLGRAQADLRWIDGVASLSREIENILAPD